MEEIARKNVMISHSANTFYKEFASLGQTVGTLIFFPLLIINFILKLLAGTILRVIASMGHSVNFHMKKFTKTITHRKDPSLPLQEISRSRAS